MRKLIKEISKGKNNETNIPVYVEKMGSVYKKTALIHLSMNYDTLFEQVYESSLVSLRIFYDIFGE
jgi:hypothetical protein